MSRMAHQGIAPAKKRSFMLLPGEPPPNKGDVDQVLLIVFRHGIKDEVNSEVEGFSPLLLPAGSASINPVSNLVSLPGAAKIIMAVDDGGRISYVDSFEVGMDHSHAADFPKEVVTS